MTNAFELSRKGLWTGSPERYHDLVDNECAMVLPTAPFVLTGLKAIKAVADTPRWSSAVLSEKQIMRPQEGWIMIAYKAQAEREKSPAYVAFTVRRLEHEVGRVVQHSQTLLPVVGASQPWLHQRTVLAKMLALGMGRIV